MFAIRKGNTITIAPLEDALVGLESGWAIRFADKPQFLFHISRTNLDGSKMTMDRAIENCARIARREGLDLRSNACNAQVFELAATKERPCPTFRYEGRHVGGCCDQNSSITA